MFKIKTATKELTGNQFKPLLEKATRGSVSLDRWSADMLSEVVHNLRWDFVWNEQGKESLRKFLIDAVDEGKGLQFEFNRREKRNNVRKKKKK